MASQTYIDGVSLTAAAEFNRFDTAAYPVFSGVTGTSNVTATGPANYQYSSTNPVFVLKPGFANPSTVTLNVTPSGGAALGEKNLFFKGAACAGGELVASVPVLVAYDGTQFNIVGGAGVPKLTNSLGADVAVSTTAAFYDGPTVAQGTVGTWYASGGVTFNDPSAAAAFFVKLWDGTSNIAAGVCTTPAAGFNATMHLSGYITSPVGNIKISLRNVSTTNSSIIFNSSGTSTDSTLSAIRIA